MIDENNNDALWKFNDGESGFSTVQKWAIKALSKKGKHQIGALFSGEREVKVNTTFVHCARTSEMFVSPMTIFKQQVGIPSRSLAEVSESNYINLDLTVKWLIHFFNYVIWTTENKALLVLDAFTSIWQGSINIQLNKWVSSNWTKACWLKFISWKFIYSQWKSQHT